MNRKISGLPALLTWQTLCRLEPHLLQLERIASRLQPGDWREWKQIKNSLQWLVGWNAKPPAMRTPEAYELAYSHLLEVWGG